MKSGILLLDKRPGMTSFDCIRELKRVWKRSDLGHGGTLDRFASGLLPILLGDGLKLVRFFLESHPTLPTYWKSYAGVLEFGIATETGDPEGSVMDRRDTGELAPERVQEAMSSFVNTRYEQMPPRYSAKKIDGERASDLARQGKAPELKPVAVTIREFRCLGIEGNLVRFEAECSKGAYVRALAEDLARRLDTVAHVRTLRRVAVGDFKVGDALTLEQVAEREMDSAILDLSRATEFLPKFPLIGNEAEQLKVGKVDGLTTRLANSGLAPGVYCATVAANKAIAPLALLELTTERRGHFLRAFNA